MPSEDVLLRGLSKDFGSTTAVHPMDLRIPQGSFFALLGASGCGKTTTLRMIAGLEEPTAGTVLIGDQDITGLPPHRRPVNTVFQSYALFPHLNVSENVAFGLRRRGIRSVRKPVEAMLELVQLGGFGTRRPHQLSGGQQQRVALARALINEPRVLLLDEPLGALDLKLRRQMQVELKRIQTEVGITFVHVTHDQEEAMSMADTVAVMHAGRVEQLGAPEALYETPATAFVAEFLGQSNLVAATVTGRQADGALALATSGGVLTVAGDRLGRHDVAPAGTKLMVGVRPEKISLAFETDSEETIPPGRNRIPGTVTDASFTGVSTQYRVRAADGQEIAVFAQNLDPRKRARPGDEAVLHFDPGQCFVLDAAGAAEAAAAATADAEAGAETDGVPEARAAV
jgi:spermidine/putrescine transport system ATP-binding protein